MSSLIKKQLVIKSTTRVPLFYLSKEGEDLAKKLKNKNKDGLLNESEEIKTTEQATKKTLKKVPTFNDDNSTSSCKFSQESTIKQFDQIVLSDDDDDIIEDVVIKPKIPKIHDIPLKERLKLTNKVLNNCDEIQTITSDDDLPQVTLEKKATKPLRKSSNDNLEIISDDEPKITATIQTKPKQTYLSSDDDDLPSIDFGFKPCNKNKTSKVSLEIETREETIFKKPAESFTNKSIQINSKEANKINNKSQPDIIDTFQANTYEIIMIVDNCVSEYRILMNQ
jgi:hypothetical protein